MASHVKLCLPVVFGGVEVESYLPYLSVDWRCPATNMEVERASLTFSSDICLEGLTGTMQNLSINIVLVANNQTETRSRTLREEHRLRVFENGAENIWTEEG
jgi:hypothetical protein